MERLGSHKYRWKETVLDSKAAKAQAKASAAPGSEYLMLRQRVAQAMDTTGWGTILVMIDVVLSVFSVMIYIAMTYHPLDAFYHIDLALACIFTLNWVYWFWIAEDRLRYVFSFLTLVDVVTILPAFVMYGVTSVVGEAIPGLNFLRVLRILRVLRVFRMKHIMRRHMEGAVVEAAGKLVFSLLSIVFIAAGLFFELEKYGPNDDEKKTKDLKFHQSIYWATVTLTTVGYGDIVPTYWATQVMVIGLLMLTLSLVPYLTGQLMDALTSTSTYQRRSFKPSRRSDVSHVVITGALDGPTVKGVLDELYHEDKGFNHNHAVLLSERGPSLDVQHVLATHVASRKLCYLQGSPFRPEDLSRAGVEYASAVFIVAPKYPEDPTTSDRYLDMVALSLGQYLQEVHVNMEERLSHTPNRVMHWIKHGSVLPPERLPDVYLQVCLPEGRLRLFQILQSLQEQHSKPAAAAAAATAGGGSSQAAAAGAAADAAPQLHDGAAAAPAEQGEDDTAMVADEAAAAGECDSLRDAAQAHTAGAAGRLQHSSTAGASLTPSAAASFPRPSEAAAAVDSDAVPLGCYGDATVDMSAFPDAAGKTPEQLKQQQQQQQPMRRGWFDWCCAPGCCGQQQQQLPPRPHPYSTGTCFWQDFSASIHVLCLSEIKYAMMAQSIVGVPGAMTLLCNLSTTVDFSTGQDMESLPPWLCEYMAGASQELYKLERFPETLLGRSVKETTGFIFDSCHAVLLAVERTEGLQRHRMMVGDLRTVITPDMVGYIVASDVSAVLLISNAQLGDFELWHKLREQHLLAAAGQSKGVNSSGKDGSSGGWRGCKGRSRSGGGGGQPAWRSSLMKSSSLMMPSGPQPRVQQCFSEPGTSSLVGVAAGVDAAGHVAASTHQGDDDTQYFQEQQQQQQRPATWNGAASVTGGAPGSSTAASPAVAAATAEFQADINSVSHKLASGHASALGALMHLLRSPSRALRQEGEAILRQHYHMRPEPVQWEPWKDPNMDTDLSQLAGHILVLGVPASQDGLLSLLAMLRSKRLLQLRPIVIIDANQPGGGSWEAVAQFSDVYFIYAGNGLNDALLRASADRAAQAILMTPLVSHDYEDEDHRLASKVMTDAVVINSYQLLKSINPSIELVTELMMPQSVSFLSATTPARGVDYRYLHLVSPAYVSGSVFHARLLDDLMIASYCNSASDRLVLQLLHRWHMGWAGVQAFSTVAQEQHEVMPTVGQMVQETVYQAEQQQQQQQQEEYQALVQQQQQQQQQQPAGTQPQAPWQAEKFKLAATAVLRQLSKAAGLPQEQLTAVLQGAARAVEQRGVPVLMQIPVDCPPGTTYGRYFHTLLLERGLLLLGVHRLVQQDGCVFRATITNPDYHAEMQPDDNAFVVARLQLPTDPSDAAAVAAAWPPDTLGFGHLDAAGPGTQQQQQQQPPEVWAPAAADANAPAATLTSLDSWLPTDAAVAAPAGDTVTAAGPGDASPVGAGPPRAATAGGAVQQRQQDGTAAAGSSGNRAASSPGGGGVSSFPLYGVIQSAMRSAGSGYLQTQQPGQGTEQEDMAGAAPRVAGPGSAPGVGGGQGGSSGGGQQVARRSVRVVPPGIPGGVVYHPGEGGAPARK